MIFNLFRKISEKTSTRLVEKNIIQASGKELYSYGIRNGLLLLLNIITVVVIGIIFGDVLRSILFMSLYIPLRSFAGGYHARTPQMCYIFSVMLIIAVLLAMKHLDISCFICIISINILYVIIALLSPVEDVNKRLDTVERKVFKTRTIIVILVEDVFNLGCLLLKRNDWLECSFLVVVVVVLLILLGKITNITRD